jgi:hypothetical protein
MTKQKGNLHIQQPSSLAKSRKTLMSNFCCDLDVLRTICLEARKFVIWLAFIQVVNWLIYYLIIRSLLHVAMLWSNHSCWIGE